MDSGREKESAWEGDDFDHLSKLERDSVLLFVIRCVHR